VTPLSFFNGSSEVKRETETINCGRNKPINIYMYDESDYNYLIVFIDKKGLTTSLESKR
jgi:hypothetical protein